jgi:hypothetical protein
MHLLLDPPPWLKTQLRNYGEDPDRFRESVCTAVAAKSWGDPSRWREVVPVLNGSK